MSIPTFVITPSGVKQSVEGEIRHRPDAEYAKLEARLVDVFGSSLLSPSVSACDLAIACINAAQLVYTADELLREVKKHLDSGKSNGHA